MKQYDKVYVPHPTGDYEVFEIGFEDPERGRLINEENVIVLTIEELKEVWKVAQFFERQITTGFTLDDYLTSKGIIL